MSDINNWVLPEGIEELLPDEALRLEKIRRDLIDLFASWGYQFVIPPLIEFLDSLLAGTNSELALQTFKLTDQISGKTLGIRADMTPQIARMAAHHIKKCDAPVRLSYLGTVLHARGAQIEKSRSPIQLGAELYGSQHIKSDVEIIQLMLEVLAVSAIQHVHLDLGHVGVYRGLAQQAGLTTSQEGELLDVLQRKSSDEVVELLETYKLDKKWVNVFVQLLQLNGDVTVLEQAKKVLKLGDASVQQAIEELQEIAALLQQSYPSLPLYFDLAELRCYRYQTGVVFAAFVPGFGSEIARGGRYDNLMIEQGEQVRSATGFSADLKVLTRLMAVILDEQAKEIILAPDVLDENLQGLIRELRTAGKTVIMQLPDSSKQPNHTALIAKVNDKWSVS
ncbi:MAG: ATP phosphoribosyltransferase regulatory subunit [Cycloclasticus sp. symbiont of Poecilosclerida sp. M]|nr:MAG: ATP phosphoribosyltransferase regulatory subunit [Cycloclasticus sp. symbiont of Poecilosclerida sp. M]